MNAYYIDWTERCNYAKAERMTLERSLSIFSTTLVLTYYNTVLGAYQEWINLSRPGEYLHYLYDTNELAVQWSDFDFLDRIGGGC